MCNVTKCVEPFDLRVWSIAGLITSPKKSYCIMPELVKRKCKNPDAYLDEQDLKDIAESEEDIRQGRVYTHEELGKILGFHK